MRDSEINRGDRDGEIFNTVLGGTEGTEIERFSAQRHRDTELHREALSLRGNRGDRRKT